MSARLTRQARHVVDRAQVEASELGHRRIGTEHLLLALLDPQAGATHEILSGTGLDQHGVRDRARRLVAADTEVLSQDDAVALKAIGIDLGAVREKLEAAFGPGALEVPEPRRRGLVHRLLRRWDGGHIPFSDRAKKVLELALREAIRLRHNFIGPEHLLLGLLREGRGRAARILADAQVDVDELRRRTVQALSQAA